MFSGDHFDGQSFGVFANPHRVIYTPDTALALGIFTASKARSIPNPKIAGRERGGEITPPPTNI